MGSMSTCMGGINSHTAREVQFNLINSSGHSLRGKRKQSQIKQRSNSPNFAPIKNNVEFISKKEGNNKYKKDFDKERERKKIIRFENIVNINLNNNGILKNKSKGRTNIKQKKLESTEDFCEIIEGEDEFECDRNLSNSNKKRKDIINDNKVNYLFKQNKIIHNIQKINSYATKKEKGGNENIKGNNQIVIKDYEDKGKQNLKYSINNLNSYKISNTTNLSFPDKNESNLKKINDNNSTNIYLDNIKNSNKKNKDFNNCKVDNNISFNINNSLINRNNNIPNTNNLNNFNNISSINSDFNNNNYIDISSNMTYFLSLEKSHHKPLSTRFDKKKILSLNNNNPNINNNSSYNKDIITNKYRNSVKVNNYKWKLLPKHKYNTQIYKSLMNIPNIPLTSERQSLLMNEDEQKNLNITNVTPMINKNENSRVISEIKKQKEEQDKLIKSLEYKIKNLEKKINTENMTKINEKKIQQINSMNNKLAETQKDFRIKKLEEQLSTVRKNNKLNKSLLKKKEEQIKNLIEDKNKQEKLIKKFEIKKSIKPKNSKHSLLTKSSSKDINYLEDLSKSYNYNNFLTNNSNSNLCESKFSFTNINNSLNMNKNKSKNKNKIKLKESLNNQIKKFHKKEKSISLQNHFLKNN